MNVLSTLYDPELPMSVVDLGLIYRIQIDHGHVTIEMTFTSMGCPCHLLITNAVHDLVSEINGVESVEVDVVWDPPWTRERITPQGRKTLANWGINT